MLADDNDLLLREGVASLLTRSGFGVVRLIGAGASLVAWSARSPRLGHCRHSDASHTRHLRLHGQSDPQRTPADRHSGTFTLRRCRTCDGAARQWATGWLSAQPVCASSRRSWSWRKRTRRRTRWMLSALFNYTLWKASGWLHILRLGGVAMRPISEEMQSILSTTTCVAASRKRDDCAG